MVAKVSIIFVSAKQFPSFSFLSIYDDGAVASRSYPIILTNINVVYLVSIHCLCPSSYLMMLPVG